MMLQDLSPCRVVAGPPQHARAVVVSTTHLPMAMAGPWTVRVPTHGPCRAHVVRCDATARAVDKSYVWMSLQDLSPSRVVAASDGYVRPVEDSATHLPMVMAGPWTVRVPTHGRCHAHSYGVTSQRGSWMRARYG